MSPHLCNCMLSKLLAHDKFRQLMVDAEVYVDRIADSKINNMNAMFEAVRQQLIQQYAAEDGDSHTRTLTLAPIQTAEYFKQVLSDNLIDIPSNIWEFHKRDATTADGESATETVSEYLQTTISYEGSPQKTLVRVYLAGLDITMQSPKSSL